MRGPELLSPAGDFTGLTGAVAAGADAVYLGGERFSARAYAGNFSEEELIRGIRFAHLRGVRIYLALNILIKESELDALHDFVAPLERAGLDGAIVQDLGVMTFLQEHFPRIRLHASTQMAVTGPYAARLLYQRGIRRIVPARELSLKELMGIKRAVPWMEIEAFIHGAMCYSYSGMCLFSGMIGGRSGNRGRCAGACRLPYEVTEAGSASPLYPLSLRDMCTLSVMQQLITPGAEGEPVIDSLKIEGRMKDPVYTAGVTSIYRRVIDEIMERRDKQYLPSREDLSVLKSLYLRSDLSEGYYFKYNGKNMITGHTPGYIGSDEAVADSIRARYIDRIPKLPVLVELRAMAGEPLALTISCGEARATAHGAPVEEARSAAATKEDLRQQLDRFGESDFIPMVLSPDSREEAIRVRTDGKSFVPASALNHLRREACERLSTEILARYARGREAA